MKCLVAIINYEYKAPYNYSLIQKCIASQHLESIKREIEIIAPNTTSI